MTREELIKALGTATGPDRTLDAEIGALLHLLPADAPNWLVNWGGPFKAVKNGHVAAMHSDGREGVHWAPPPFTGSLDAAWTLIPKGYFWRITQESDRKFHALVAIDPRIAMNSDYAISATPALAMCLTCLKALRAREGRG